MKRRDIVIGILILVMLSGVIYWKQRRPSEEEMRVPETLSLEQELEEKFKLQIPEDVDKAELKAVEGKTGSGIATRKFEGGKFTHEVLADLPEAPTGSFYEGWLLKGKEGSEEFSLISTGRMKLAKGGWIVNFESTINYSDHNKVIITLEKKADRAPEEHVLEGSF